MAYSYMFFRALRDSALWLAKKRNVKTKSWNVIIRYVKYLRGPILSHWQNLICSENLGYVHIHILISLTNSQ